MRRSGSRVGEPRRGLRALVMLAQCVLGVLFLFSGLMKGIDPMGTAIKIGEYATKFGLPISDTLATISSVGLNVFEALLGVCLLTGVRRRTTALLTLLLLVPMTLLTLYIYIYNPVSDCGCFGDALKISNGATFWKNVLFLALASLLYRRSGDMWQVLGERADFLIVIGSMALLFHFNIYPLRYLPVLDFRPYKVGSSLHELTQAGASEGTYDYRYVYEKGGEERTFTLDELSNIDDTWSYVRDETIELTAPQSAPGADFVLIDSEGVSHTEELAQSGQNALLFIVRDLSAVSAEEMKIGAELQALTGAPVTLVAGNSFDEIHNSTNAEKSAPYSAFYFLDRTTAKTALRANPGLLVIGDGRIARKASLAQVSQLLRDEQFRADPYQMMSQGEQQKGRWMTFGPLGIGALVIVLLGIRKRIKRD